MLELAEIAVDLGLSKTPRTAHAGLHIASQRAAATADAEARALGFPLTAFPYFDESRIFRACTGKPGRTGRILQTILCVRRREQKKRGKDKCDASHLCPVSLRVTNQWYGCDLT